MNARRSIRSAIVSRKELDRNFSVVAAAGSGKTRAVTDRIVQLALAPGAVDTLPRLVVLTFANRAADEMQQRAREQILAAKPGPGNSSRHSIAPGSAPSTPSVSSC